MFHVAACVVLFVCLVLGLSVCLFVFYRFVVYIMFVCLYDISNKVLYVLVMIYLL